MFSGLLRLNGKYWLYGLWNTEQTAIIKTREEIDRRGGGIMIGAVKLTESDGQYLDFLK